ncbi:serine protease inhibitor 42Dd [Drosophila mojavensis]|uniref:Acp48 n=2 Tax=Drosophila mojavensis TaxID=7230 RepID=B4KIJ8_DROMO|nr:serine protease inhibitor 42Dd [Drosophila mojavensis]EDW11341.1 Acp48 [Drosophila mojavensis]
MVGLSYTLFGIVFLALAARELSFAGSLNMKLMKAVLQGNSTASAVFSPRILTNTMREFSEWTAGNTAAQINRVMMFKKDRQGAVNKTDVNTDYTDEVFESSENFEFTNTDEDYRTNCEDISSLRDDQYRSISDVIRIKSAWFVAKSVVPAVGTSVKVLDFKTPKKALQVLNKWTAQITNNRIKNFMKKTTPDMKIVLITAAHYETKWKYSFSPKLTKKVNFHTSPTKTTPVDMMSIEGKFLYKYIKKVDADVLQMPFKHKDLMMTILVPKKANAIGSLIQKLTTLHLRNLKLSGKAKAVNVQLPKFKIDFEVDLKKPMQNLGIRDLFKKANFSQLATYKGVMKVDHIIQRVVLDVNERGASMAVAARASTKEKFVVDRPFLFLLRQVNDVFLAGRVNFPPK